MDDVTGSTAAAPPHYKIPPGVYVALDELDRQWTNVPGAAVLAGKSRRTIFNWIRNEWVVVRRTASGLPEVLVASLWQAPEGAK